MCGCILERRSVGYNPWVTVILTSDLVYIVWCISPIFFDVVIPNLVCGCILGWRSVAYHFRVTVALTSDLAFRIIIPSISYEVECVGASWDDGMSCTILGSLRP